MTDSYSYADPEIRLLECQDTGYLVEITLNQIRYEKPNFSIY